MFVVSFVAGAALFVVFQISRSCGIDWTRWTEAHASLVGNAMAMVIAITIIIVTTIMIVSIVNIITMTVVLVITMTSSPLLDQ